MVCSGASGDLSAEVDFEAYRRLFPLQYFERLLTDSLRPDARQLRQARDTTLALGAVGSANGSALAKIGSTTILAAIKMEIMTPATELPDEGNIAIEFHMPPICSPIVRPGRPAEVTQVISKQLSDTILSSGMINLKELSLVSGKAAWMAYLDIYCLNSDVRIPVVSLNDEGRVVVLAEDEKDQKNGEEPLNKVKRKLTLNNIPFSLTCILHKNYILADPTSEEESVMETMVTVVLNGSDQLVSLYKSGGSILLYTSTLQDCVALTKQRLKELRSILDDALSEMEVD
ncbi:hypothetical protein V2J09_006119 [Rumex salicifolius]